MRDLKIRLWDELKNKMWYSDNISTLDFESKCVWIKQQYKGGHWVYLRNAKVLNFTGLKDKNGVEIYEGDILVIPIGIRTEKFLHVIKWEKETASFILEEVEEGNMTWYFDDLPYETGEVIGNIFENPELLENNQ